MLRMRRGEIQEQEEEEQLLLSSLSSSSSSMQQKPRNRVRRCMYWSIKGDPTGNVASVLGHFFGTATTTTQKTTTNEAVAEKVPPAAEPLHKKTAVA